VDLSGPRCMCGNRGCLEMYVSNRALLRYIGEYYNGIDAWWYARLTWEDAVAAYHDGNPAAVHAVGRLNDALAAGIVNATNLINPDTIVLGGASMSYGEAFLNRVSDKVRGTVIYQYKNDLMIHYARHSVELLAPGAAQDAYERSRAAILFSG